MVSGSFVAKNTQKISIVNKNFHLHTSADYKTTYVIDRRFPLGYQWAMPKLTASIHNTESLGAIRDELRLISEEISGVIEAMAKHDATELLVPKGQPELVRGMKGIRKFCGNVVEA